MYDTNVFAGSDGTTDCLIDIRGAQSDVHSLSTRVPEHLYQKTHRFCRRPILSPDEHIPTNESLPTMHGDVFAFDQLRSMNITSRQLYHWYASTDIIEDYISGEPEGMFVNCSDTLFFGSRCEYTFDSSDNLGMLLMNRFMNKIDPPDNLSLYTNGTCYDMMVDTCDAILCLDWREVCDGKMDCSNGFDEHRCQELEMNECDSSTEQRCYDGQCVDSIDDIWTNRGVCSKHHIADAPVFKYCHNDFREDCENERCALLEFSCGDGYCYDQFTFGENSCRSQRDKRYFDKLSESSPAILFPHVHLIHNQTQPQFICYNPTLCPYLSSKNLTIAMHTPNGFLCHAFDAFVNQTYPCFGQMVIEIKHLVRSCSSTPFGNTHLNRVCPIYQCNDGGKCLSVYRLLDGFEDCSGGEDEYTIQGCISNLPGRFSCDNGTKCISDKLVSNSASDCDDGTDESIVRAALIRCLNPFSMKCPFYEDQETIFKLTFDQICNGIVEYIADGNNNTDETGCLTREWPCDMVTFKCDRLWNCPDGRDELDCNVTSLASIYCNNTEHFCLDIDTGEQKCLSTVHVNDGTIHCLGSLDERDFCRMTYPYEWYFRYRCRNSTKCIVHEQLCDYNNDCPEGDDEETACIWLHSQPNSSQNYYQQVGMFCDEDRDPREYLFCDLIDMRSTSFWAQHQKKPSSATTIQHQLQRRSTETLDASVIWTCNRGLYVRSTKDSSGFVCLCSDYYYGDRCQYQRKRVKIILRIQMKSSFNHQSSLFKIVVLLVHINKTSVTIVAHDQLIYVPRFNCLPKFYVLLLYPMKEPYRSSTNYSIHVHVFDIDTLEHRYSRNYPLLFDFLPLQTVVKRVLVPETRIDAGSKQVPLSYIGCTSCSNTSRCLGRDVSLARDICVCTSNHIGRRCLVPFNPCTNSTCRGHGQCRPLATNRDITNQYMCLCDLGWYGHRCQYKTARVYVSLSRDLSFPPSTVAFLHLIDVFAHQGRVINHWIYFHRLSKETLNLTFVINGTEEVFDGGFIQFYEHQYKFDYYFLFLRHVNDDKISEIHVEVQAAHRCWSINEIFDKHILAQPDIRRVKNYQRVCREHQKPFLCFYDDHLMCTCTEDHQSFCFSFQTHLDTCDSKDCNDQGMCVQDHDKCPYISHCICQACAYGRFCEFSTAGYTLSLDGIIGSHILLTTTNLREQSATIQTAVVVVLIYVCIGLIANAISLCTFIQRRTHEVGCGLYLLVSSIIGLLTLITLVCKTVLLLNSQRSDVNCAIVEFLLNWCPTSCKWLNTGVAVERTVAIKYKTRYCRLRSKKYAKWVAPAILLFAGLLSTPELFFRRIIIDKLDERAWCVLTLNNSQPGLLAFYSILNIASFLIPFVVNLSSAVIIIRGTAESKKKTSKQPHKRTATVNTTWRSYFEDIKKQIILHKYMLMTPILLAILSLPQVILTFVFVCTKLDQNSIPSLIAYLAAFLPTMAIPFAFVLPSQTYRAAFLASMKRIF